MKRLAALCALLLLICSTACLKQSRLTPLEEVPKGKEVDLQVLVKNGTTYDLGNVTVGPDGIRGGGTCYLVDGRQAPFYGNIPLSDISLVKTVRKDAIGSLVAYGTIGILFGAVIAAASDDTRPVAYADIVYPSGDGSYGSCPRVFAWDGTSYRFESQTFAGAFCPVLEFTQVECMSHLAGERGEYRLALANQSPESHHTNLIGVIAVDHPPGTIVRLDNKGAPRTISHHETPLWARAYDSTDVLAAVLSKGDLLWESDLSRSHAERDGIVCEFTVPAGARVAKLLVTTSNTGMGEYAVHKLLSLRGPGRMAWNHELESDSMETRRLRGWLAREGGLDVFVACDSSWIHVEKLLDVGGMVQPERVVSVDLDGWLSRRLRVRLEGTAGLWCIDRVAVDYSEDEPVQTTSASFLEALTGDGRNVTRQLAEQDSLYYAALPDDYAILRFAEVPSRPNSERSYLLVSRGYYHPWVDEAATDYKPIIDQVFEQPHVGQQMYLAEWMAQRQRYPKFGDEPTFSPASVLR